MYDYGSPEKNKEHYGNVSVMITFLLTSLLVALILSFYIKQDQFLQIILSLSLISFKGIAVGLNSQYLILSAWIAIMLHS